MKTKELINFLVTFPPDSIVLIESSDGEYGPMPIERVNAHAGKDEPYGINYPAIESFKGCPVLRA